LQLHKAAGPDGISLRLVLKDMAASIAAPILTTIFQASLKQDDLPDDWRTASVVPVFEKGSRLDPSNYRPISPTCICCKLLSTLFTHLYPLTLLTTALSAKSSMVSENSTLVKHNYLKQLMT